jgi:hypothetical protein
LIKRGRNRKAKKNTPMKIGETKENYDKKKSLSKYIALAQAKKTFNYTNLVQF